MIKRISMINVFENIYIGRYLRGWVFEGRRVKIKIDRGKGRERGDFKPVKQRLNEETQRNRHN